MSALELGRIWAAAPLSPNIDPGATKYNLGWVPEIPVYQMLNYINNRYDTNIVSLAERGVFEWGNDIAYKSAALVWDEADGYIYVSKVASPSTTTRPGLNAAQWDKSATQISRKQYDDAVTAWNAHTANTSNPHALTTEILNTYTKAVIDSKVATNQGNINTHISNHSNPHGVTATQAGAVPVTGGDYSGLVRHLFASTGLGASALACSLLADATGAFLAKGTNAKLGIDNLYKPVFIDDSAVKSNLLLDSNYQTSREAIEADYVAPVPDCQIDFRNNLNLVYGVGSCTFAGPAGSRGYTDKSGVAQTAALNTPRYTSQGLYLNGATDVEVLSLPQSMNLVGSDFTVMLDFQSVTTTNFLLRLATDGTPVSRLLISGGYYVFQSLVGGVNTNFNLAAVDHTNKHKVVIVSSVTANKTYVYFDGVLSVTINNKQDAVSNSQSSTFCHSSSSWTGAYLNSFKTWLYPLTPQQVSDL